MSSPEPLMVSRAAMSCDQCHEAAIVKMPPVATRDEIHAAAVAIHARISPKCKATKLSIKYFNLPLNIERS